MEICRKTHSRLSGPTKALGCISVMPIELSQITLARVVLLISRSWGSWNEEGWPANSYQNRSPYCEYTIETLHCRSEYNEILHYTVEANNWLSVRHLISKFGYIPENDYPAILMKMYENLTAFVTFVWLWTSGNIFVSEITNIYRYFNKVNYSCSWWENFSFQKLYVRWSFRLQLEYQKL